MPRIYGELEDLGFASGLGPPRSAAARRALTTRPRPATTRRPAAKKRPATSQRAARVPTDPKKLAQAIARLRQAIRTQQGRPRAVLQANLDAHLKVAKELLKKSGLSAAQRRDLQRALGSQGEVAGPEPVAPGGGEEQVSTTSEGEPVSEDKPAPEGGEAPVETEPTTEGEAAPAEGKATVVGEEPGFAAKVKQWLWPEDEPIYKKPALWIAGVVGLVTLFAASGEEE